PLVPCRAEGLLPRHVAPDDSLLGQRLPKRIKHGEFVPDPLIQFLDIVEAQLRIEPAVHEEHVAHTGDGVVLAQPATVHASGSEGIAPIVESRWMLGHPLLAGSVVKRLAMPGPPMVQHKFYFTASSLISQLIR